MTEQEKAINDEFSNEFDVIYNNITSNQAPGLDEYEKSVFLNKAQEEVVKSYFSPKANKLMDGFDSSEERQIDFSMLIRSLPYKELSIELSNTEGESDVPTITTMGQLMGYLTKTDSTFSAPLQVIDKIDQNRLEIVPGPHAPGKPITYRVRPFIDGRFDSRDNTVSIGIENDIFMLINEKVEVVRHTGGQDKLTKLVVVPIGYTEYSRLMSKAYKRPIKNQAWRLFDTSDGYRKSEIIIGPNDTISSYTIRYVKRPRAIRLDDFDDVSIGGGREAQCCELDPILFPEIIQRGCELAKAVYTGTLSDQVALGNSSQTEVGSVPRSSN